MIRQQNALINMETSLASWKIHKELFKNGNCLLFYVTSCDYLYLSADMKFL